MAEFNEKKNESKGTPPASPHSYEEMAALLEASGMYKVARKLLPPAVASVPRPEFPRRGLIVDTETTGLNHHSDRLIEIGAISFTYDDEGNVGDVLGSYGGLQDPGMPIPDSITRLTGITADALEGRAIDVGALEKLVAPADLVIAHNAAFDRPFCEKITPLFETKAWACSVKEIDWVRRGFEGAKLAYLIGQAGLFHEGHRAVDDCYALFEILRRPLLGIDSSAFSELLASSKLASVKIWAENSPFEKKEKLKERQYRWSDGSDGKPKAWWTEVDTGALEDELKFLRTEIYRRDDITPTIRRIEASNRYKR